MLHAAYGLENMFGLIPAHLAFIARKDAQGGCTGRVGGRITPLLPANVKRRCKPHIMQTVGPRNHTIM